MKRLLFVILAAMMTAGVATAQNYMVVDSEKVFKSLKEYTNALDQIETLSAEYQQQVDAKFAEVERLYNTYMTQRGMLSESQRQSKEREILDLEQQATEFQESLFGTEGKLMKRRMELIQPIQKRVFETLESFAQQNGYDLVIDIAANPTVLYYSAKVDYTDKIIEALK
ncbi:MAG: OmpH family outer membrane protein [Alistipes sp.]|jgi:outer membrane protein|nr:OmpH family outer membrane protein [Alistipes sp.]